jgi:AcrR family transcriptional regulator
VPKISAPTVAEHRAAQRAALVRSAEELLLDGGVTAVNARAVTERAGLARSSFYDYFPSRDDLLVAVVIDAMERWDQEIEAALVGVTPGLEQLRTFVDATMRMTGDGAHRLAGILRQAELAPTKYEDMMALHDAIMRPLVTVVSDLGVAEPRRVALLAQGVLSSGMQFVEHGADAGEIAASVYRMLVGGISA